MRISWAGPATRDLSSIRAYIAQDSEYYADRFIERIVGAVESLSTFPEMGRTVPETNSPDIREILFQTYRIIYRVETDRVLIIAVAHAARDLTIQTPKPWDIT
ncbi:MAG TPA: type II toxin-antitoxin system RelE/ParE family toxin [bacterium]|nr:type II toxin-antitoxin system RelE/ParE family toxin [bacterium]